MPPLTLEQVIEGAKASTDEFIYARTDDVAELIAKGLVEQRTDVVNPITAKFKKEEREYATRPTVLGWQTANAEPMPFGDVAQPVGEITYDVGETLTGHDLGERGKAAEKETVSSLFTFEMEEAPDIKPRAFGTNQTKYPFETMPAPVIGEDGKKRMAVFFVPVSAEVPNPKEVMQSATSAAHKRFAVDTGKKKTVTYKGKEVERAIVEYTKRFYVEEATVNGVKGVKVYRTA